MPGIKGTMEEFKAGKLHSGSKHGPEVKSRAQAIAIGLSEERKEGHKVPKPKHPHKSTTHHEGYAPPVEHDESQHGFPGEHLRLKKEPHRLGNAAAPAIITAPTEQGWKGTSGGKPHGFGHAAHQRHGALRMSGVAGAHRVGSRKK